MMNSRAIGASMQTDVVPNLVEVPVGEFLMGESDDDKFANKTERPKHRVTFASRFALGRRPVTVGDWQQFDPDHTLGEDPNLPVVNVSWTEAQDFCMWLAAHTGRAFRLPSEAEWEYACRAGTCTAFAGSSSLSPGDANFLFSEAGERIGSGGRTPVGAYPPNAWGFYDMHGNVCEWTEDRWHPCYEGAPSDGRARLDDGEEYRRVIRGGAWDYMPRLLRSAWRDALPPETRRDNLGFRVALTLEAV